MSTELKPKLRDDLRMRWLEEVDAKGRPMCELEDPRTGKTIKIRRPDYNFVRGFDGNHDFDDAMERAMAMGIAIKRPEAQQVYELLDGQGFLTRVAASGPPGPPPGMPAVPPGAGPRPAPASVAASPRPPVAPPPPAARPPPAAPPRPAPPPPERPSVAPQRPSTMPVVEARETHSRFPMPPLPPEDAVFEEPERTIADPRMARIVPREVDPELTPPDVGPPASFDEGPTVVSASGWQPRISEVPVDRAPEGPLPRLRPDLLVRERPLGSSVVYEMVDPLTRRTLALYPAELAVARELDGARDLFALLELAREKGLGVPPAKLATFVRMLQQSGFLEASQDAGLGRNEFSVMAPLPMAPPSAAPLAVIPQAEVPAVAAPLPTWNAEERRLFQVALSLFRRGLVDDAENRLLALLEIDPNHKEAKTLLEVVQRDKQRSMTLADVQRDLVQVSAEVAPALDESVAAAGPGEPPAVAVIEEPKRSAAELRRLARRAALRRWAIRLAVLGALFAAAAFIPYPLRARGPATAHPRDRGVVRAPIEGVIDRVEVDEGGRVRAGQTVAVLYDRDLRVQLAQREADRQQADAQLAMLRAGGRPEQIEAARRVLAGRQTEASLKERECAQIEQQVRQRVSPEAELRSCNEALASKRSAAAEARAQLAVVSAGARPEEIQAAEARLRRTSADVSEIQAKLDQTSLRSPIDGVITTPHFRDRVHEKIAVGDVVCEVARLDVMRVEIRIPESDMDLPRVGQFVRLRFSNIPEQSFMGRVIEIGQQVETETVSGTTTNFVRVVSEVRNPNGVLRGGLTGFGDVMAGDATLLRTLTRELLRRLSLKILT